MSDTKVIYPVHHFTEDCILLAKMITRKTILHKPAKRYNAIYGIPSGGIPVAMRLADILTLPLISDPSELGPAVLIVDDLIDTGRTISQYEGYDVAVLHKKKWAKIQPTYCVHDNCEDWIVYWWEGSEEKSIEDSVLRQLQFIGDDPTREGLEETPARVTRSWGELYSGYGQDPTTLLKTFDSAAYKEIVLLKDIEFYSMCEHHMLPFIGKAHIAYIPDKRVVGISKLARLLEVFTRRLQIQERIGEQVTSILMQELDAIGAACVIEAQHLCMLMRGVQKQNSIMKTSSLKGVFLEDSRKGLAARAELMRLIR